MKKTFLFIAASAILFSCGNAEPEQKTESNQTTTEQEEESDEISKEDMQADFDATDEYVSKITENFEFQEDKVAGGGWYFHKDCCKKNNTHIEVPVAANGYFYLKSHYTGSDWLFHRSITVSIDGNARASSKLDPSSDFVTHKIGGKGIYETVHYTSPVLDMKIVQLIAQNIDKEIIVRFNGDETNFDLTLSDADKKRIKDSYMLSRYLTYSENDEITYQDAEAGTPIKDLIVLTKFGTPKGDIKSVNYTK